MGRDRPVREWKAVVRNQLPTLATEMLALAGDRRVWLFYGEMGSGKTTLIKAICACLDVKDLVSSPTFSIVNEYLAGDDKVFHFDFYRIKSEAEAYDIGTEDYFYSGSYCFVEWPGKVPSLIPPSAVTVHIQSDENECRTIAISVYDGEEEIRV